MVDLNRHKVSVHVASIDSYDIGGSLGDFISRLFQILEDKLHKPYERVEVGFVGPSYDGGAGYINIVGIRDEDDTEFANRIEREANAGRMQDERDRETYLRLKERFGDG